MLPVDIHALAVQQEHEVPVPEDCSTGMNAGGRGVNPGNVLNIEKPRSRFSFKYFGIERALLGKSPGSVGRKIDLSY